MWVLLYVERPIELLNFHNHVFNYGACLSSLLYVPNVFFHCLAEAGKPLITKINGTMETAKTKGLSLSLLCTEPGKQRRSKRDLRLVKDERVLQNLLIAEEQLMPNAACFDFQPEIKPHMRHILANWMLEVILLFVLKLISCFIFAARRSDSF